MVRRHRGQVDQGADQPVMSGGHPGAGPRAGTCAGVVPVTPIHAVVNQRSNFVERP
jgi:hypothetical protein